MEIDHKIGMWSLRYKGRGRRPEKYDVGFIPDEVPSLLALPLSPFVPLSLPPTLTAI
jgi:hypothetical protein